MAGLSRILVSIKSGGAGKFNVCNKCIKKALDLILKSQIGGGQATDNGVSILGPELGKDVGE